MPSSRPAKNRRGALIDDAKRDLRGLSSQAIYRVRAPLSHTGPVGSGLLDLHDPATGRLDAQRMADYLSVPLKLLSGAFGKNYSTVHKTPASLALQPALRPIERSLVILEDLLGDRVAALVWLNRSHPDLGRRTPLEVILEGHAQVVEDMLDAAVEGIPS